MAIPLSEATRALTDGKNYAVLATINADGSPQTSVMWVGRDGDDIQIGRASCRERVCAIV